MRARSDRRVPPPWTPAFAGVTRGERSGGPAASAGEVAPAQLVVDARGDAARLPRLGQAGDGARRGPRRGHGAAHGFHLGAVRRVRRAPLRKLGRLVRLLFEEQPLAGELDEREGAGGAGGGLGGSGHGGMVQRARAAGMSSFGAGGVAPVGGQRQPPQARGTSGADDAR